jgi:hypothetical protein
MRGSEHRQGSKSSSLDYCPLLETEQRSAHGWRDEFELGRQHQGWYDLNNKLIPPIQQLLSKFASSRKSIAVESAPLYTHLFRQGRYTRTRLSGNAVCPDEDEHSPAEQKVGQVSLRKEKEVTANNN